VAGFKETFGGWTLRESIRYAFVSAALFALQVGIIIITVVIITTTTTATTITTITTTVVISRTALFVSQDLLIDYANRPQSKCEPLIFLLLNQTKTVWGAVFLWLVVGQERSRGQWGALVLMFLSAMLLSYDSASSHPTTTAEEGAAGSLQWLLAQPLWGVLAALGAAFISGFNCMCTEYYTRMMPRKRPAMLFACELSLLKVLASHHRPSHITIRDIIIVRYIIIIEAVAAAASLSLTHVHAPLPTPHLSSPLLSTRRC
jgi:drug/metabolite transporter (DMT)-like permease